MGIMLLLWIGITTAKLKKPWVRCNYNGLDVSTAVRCHYLGWGIATAGKVCR